MSKPCSRVVMKIPASDTPLENVAQSRAVNQEVIVKMIRNSVLFVTTLVCMTALASNTPAQRKMAELNGTKLSYEVRGSGPVIVLIHGGLADNRLWDDQFQAFAKHHRVIRYDLRG